MESYFSDYLAVFQYLTIPGLLYLFGLLILIQTHYKIQILKFLKRNKEFILYLGILFVVCSYILGFVIYLAEQEVLTFLKLSGRGYIKPEIDTKDYENLYGVLIMIRHLVFSICLLVMAVSYNFIRKGKRHKSKGFIAAVYFIGMSILFLAYFKIRIVFENWSIDNPFHWYYTFIVFLILFFTSFILVLSINIKK